jgi:hypothetical protein
MSEGVIQNMRDRAVQCRRLATDTHDEKMRWQLLDWANEIDNDVGSLEAAQHQAPKSHNQD